MGPLGTGLVWTLALGRWARICVSLVTSDPSGSTIYDSRFTIAGSSFHCDSAAIVVWLSYKHTDWSSSEIQIMCRPVCEYVLWGHEEMAFNA